MYKTFTPFAIQGTYESAQTAYSQARILAPKNPLSLLRLAELALLKEDIAEARKLLLEAINEKPNYVDAILTLASIERNEGDEDAARQRENQALAMSPNTPELYYTIGLSAYEAKQWDRAVSLFEQAVFLNTTYGNAQFMLAASYEKVGRRDDAHTILASLFAQYPENEALKEAITRLEGGGSIIVDTPVPSDVVDEDVQDPIEGGETSSDETV